jgi:hypothetical protein
MMDAQTFVETIFSWGLYLGGAMAIGLFIIATIYRAYGDERYKKAYVGSLAALILSTAGWSAVETLVGTLDSSLFPEDWMIYAIVGVSFVAAVLFFATGKVEEGKWQLFAAVMCVVAIALFTSLTNVVSESGEVLFTTEGYIVYVTSPDGYIRPGDTATFFIRADSPYSPYEYVIDYGDGTIEEYSSSSSYLEVTHTYDTEGAYSVQVTVTDGKGVKGVGYAGVGVDEGFTAPWPLDWMFSAVQNNILSVFGGMVNTPIQMLYYAPYFRMTDENPYYLWYKNIVTVAMAVLGIYLLFRFAHASLMGDDPGKETIMAFKDAIVVVILMVLGPYIYNISVGVLNSICGVVASHIELGWVYSGIAGLAMTGILLSYLSPGFGDLAAFAVIGCIITAIMGLLRYWMILAMVVVSPILLVSYLHPAFKKAVGHYLTLLSGLLLAGPITAAGLAMVTISLKESGVLGLITYMLSAPIVAGLFPWIAGTMISGNVVGGAPIMTALVGRAAGRTAIMTAARGGGAAAVAAPGGQVVRVGGGGATVGSGGFGGGFSGGRGTVTAPSSGVQSVRMGGQGGGSGLATGGAGPAREESMSISPVAVARARNLEIVEPSGAPGSQTSSVTLRSVGQEPLGSEIEVVPTRTERVVGAVKRAGRAVASYGGRVRDNAKEFGASFVSGLHEHSFAAMIPHAGTTPRRAMRRPQMSTRVFRRL